MARKRMISPEIWTSRNFSELSNFEKIVFISLFSHADDEGRGEADPTYISSITFPYDKNRRDSDVAKALQKIALLMSVQLYSVNGNDYYYMTSWKRWQKIDKPSKSKLPPPPSVGVGGDIPKTEKFDECSTNVRGVLDESSSNEIENNIKEYNNPPISPQGEGGKDKFFKEYPLLAKCKGYNDAEINYDLLSECFKNSEKLKNTYSMKWVCENYQAILNGLFANVNKDCSVDSNRAKWERWIYDRKYQAESAAEQMQTKANEDETYAELNRKSKELSISSALTSNATQAEELNKRLKEINLLKGVRLSELGINEYDLLPHYHCKECQDSGYLANGVVCTKCWNEFSKKS